MIIISIPPCIFMKITSKNINTLQQPHKIFKRLKLQDAKKFTSAKNRNLVLVTSEHEGKMPLTQSQLIEHLTTSILFKVLLKLYFIM